MTTRYITLPVEEDYRHAGIEVLVPGTRLPFNVYITDGLDIRHLFNRGMLYTKYAQDLLEEKNITEFHVTDADAPDLERYLSVASRQKIIKDDDPEVFTEYSQEKEQYHQIDRSVLISGASIDFSLYLLHKLNFSILAEATKERPVSIDEGLLSTHGDILIKKTDVQLFNAYLQSAAKESTGIPLETKSHFNATIIREVSKLVIEELLENPRSGTAMNKANTAVNNIIDSLFENSETIYDLLDMSKKDYYTYTHSVNVGVLSIGLANALHIKREEIEKLGIGAILHDIGKSAVPVEILNKQGKLTSIEFDIIKTHVMEGESILRTHKDFPKESRPAVLQHHEKLSGRGYPLGIESKDIRLFGRITAIADCYDALTTERPYKPAYTPFYALSILVKEKHDYDCDILKEFVAMLGKLQ